MLDDDEETETELDVAVVVGVCDTTCTVPIMVGWIEQ
jgi:energy-converting hydrogenase Eha subunit C